MGHAWWDGEDLAGADEDLLAIDEELERALKNCAHLLVDVAVHWRNAALSKQNSRKHNLLTYDQLTLEKRRKNFALDSFPGQVL